VGFEAQWRAIERKLPENWAEARLQLTVPERRHLDRAAALLGPASPARSGDTLRFFVARDGTAPSPHAAGRLLRRVDRARVPGTLELVASGEAEPAPETPRASLRAEWDGVADALPDDWSDIYAELELTSTDHHEPAALLLSPLNPARYGSTPGFRFRIARKNGYGGSAGMARRCFERLDEEGIHGELHILRVLCDTDNVATQGPVWYVGGRAV
jgi:hypothetical protein